MSSMKKQFGDYFLGFDIGTDSIGWAVTNERYEILKFNGKSMWGIHLFESGKTAEERRSARSSRRRMARAKERVELLRELFAEEISKVDSAFFERLDESKYWVEDRNINQKNTLFNDINYNDKNFYDEFPTIYHLRSRLIHDKTPADVRLVYLALHHIINHRGHFLFEGQDFGNAMSFESIFTELLTTLNDYGISFNCTNYLIVEQILKDKKAGLKDKKRKLAEVLNAESKQQKAVCDLLAGSTVKLSDLFLDDKLDESECSKISFSSNFDDKLEILDDILEENMYVIEKIKAVYDWSVLVDILKSNTYLSDAKIEIYNTHKNQLKELKTFVKEYIPDEYNKIFREANQKFNYCSYVGKVSKKGDILKNSICSQEEFCKFLRDLLPKGQVYNSRFNDILDKLEKNALLPKQVSKNNSVIPYQLNQKELQTILENASAYLQFLSAKDKNGISVKEKIEKILTFKIPYYVGPLNESSPNAWVVRKSGKIYPWNFENMVDLQASATKFIERMTNRCTYLIEKKVLPKDSILYSKYVIYNQLNDIKVDGEKLPIDIKNKLFEDKFLNVKRAITIKEKAIREYLLVQNFIDTLNVQITGIDGEIRGTMKSYLDFKEILGENFDELLADEIIRKIVILGDAKKMIKDNLKSEYGSILSDEQIAQILRKKYTGWGRLSKEFLTEVKHIDKSTGECMNIMTALHDTNCNLMQLLSNDFEFKDAIEDINAYTDGKVGEIAYSDLEQLYVSPAVKRSIWRTVVLAKEIRKIIGHAPKKIFIEMARGENEKKERTISRKQKLLDLYKNCKSDVRELFENLDNTEEQRLNGDKLYLYYTQMGRCMYSGEKIDLDELSSKYDIDHIFPQSKVKDDSLENRVLVKKELNAKKGDRYPIPDEVVTNDARSLWKVLHQMSLIGDEKFNRLNRKYGFSENELSGFIARQLVETRQSTKAVATILGKLFGDDSKIVYVKAGNVSRFRQENDFVKCRAVNDYHHAKDAYLNIVVGNVYDTKFTSNPLNFIRSNEKYSMNCVFNYDVVRNGKIAWDKEKSIEQVKRTMAKNNILFTRYATENKGILFDLMPLKRGNGQLPLKLSDERLKDITHYGGYNSVKGAYFILVQHEIKGKIVRTLEFVPVHLVNEIAKHEKRLYEYCSNELGLLNFKVLIPKIKINSLLCVDGFYMHLSGRTGKQLVFKCANQLILSDEDVWYLKKIVNYLDKCKTQRKTLKITENDKISCERNIEMYHTLLNKLQQSLYAKRFEAPIATLENGFEKFKMLEVNEQAQVLGEILNLTQCNSNSSNFSLIGGASSCGILVMSKDISKQKNIYIINQSPTGLFEERKDLNKI